MQKHGQAALRDDDLMLEEKQTESIDHKADAKLINSMFLKILMNLNSSK
jgi:hypothetical protein